MKHKLIMEVEGTKYKLWQGNLLVGNSDKCELKVPCLEGERFRLHFTNNFLWIQPILQVIRINGFSEKIFLEKNKEYEIDISTGPKKYIVNDRIIEFTSPQKNRSRIKVNVIQKQPPQTRSEVKIAKKINKERYQSVRDKLNSLKQYRVKFSNFYLPEDDVDKLFKLGILCDEKDYNILVMDGYKRTFALLKALTQGKLIVSSAWIMACLTGRAIQNPYLFVLKTSKLSILQAINRAIQRPLFLHQKVMLGDSGKDSNLTAAQVRELVEAGGGHYQSGGIVIGEKGNMTMEQFIENVVQQQL